MSNKKILLALFLTGCNTFDRVTHIGKAPELSEITNPQQNKNIYPISMPTPQPRVNVRGQNSLWQSGARAFFKDQRAREIGDLLSITVNLNDTADIANNTKKSRSSSQDVSVGAFGVTSEKLTTLLPDGVNPKSLFDVSSSPNHEGKGSVKRSEKLSFKIAAVVVQVLPNGNLVISGKQEIRVNFEVRDILITGIIRPEDINANNTIDSSKIAEARISYGGRGQLTDMQQSPWGQQLIDAVSPF